jgi:hypothetical protein
LPMYLYAVLSGYKAAFVPRISSMSTRAKINEKVANQAYSAVCHLFLYSTFRLYLLGPRVRPLLP